MKVNSLNFGVHIDVSLTNCSVSQLKDIIDICVMERLVLIRNQNLSVERYMEINKVWGDLSDLRIWASHPDYPAVTQVTNKFVSPGKKGLFHQVEEVRWHCDGIFVSDPEDCLVFWCQEAPLSGGLTYFADGLHAYELLNEKEQEKISDAILVLTQETSKTFLKTGVHGKLLPHEQKDLNIWASRGRRSEYKAGNIEGVSEKKKQFLKIEKSLVTKHPISEKSGLYYPFLCVSEIKNLLNPSFSHQIFYKLMEYYVGHKGRIYSHQWLPGDIIISDQTHSLHKRDSFEGVRELYRTAFWYHHGA